MGWGCYRHEMDADCENWRKILSALCDRKLEEHPPSFGRDEQVCPACYIELEEKLKAYEDLYVATKALDAARTKYHNYEYDGTLCVDEKYLAYTRAKAVVVKLRARDEAEKAKSKR